MTNLKLNQVIALEKGIKADANSAINNTYHLLKKSPLFAGQERTYQKSNDDGEEYPPEPVKLQRRARAALRELLPRLIRWYDLTVTKDAGNQSATADVVVDDETILANVPVTTLLFLEKQLVHIETLVTNLPVLDSSENWNVNKDGDFVSDPVRTNKTKKLPRSFVRAPATEKFAAQVDVFQEDVVVGVWTTMKISGGIPETERQALLAKVLKLKTAVKIAREQANMAEVQDRRIGEALFNYLGL